MSLPAPPASVGPFQVTFTLLDLATRQPVADVSAQLCNKIDVTCSSPTQAVVSDSQGRLIFAAARAFSGYVKLSKRSYVPTLYFFNPPVYGDQAITQTLASLALSGQLATQFGTPLLPDHGTVVITSQDCLGNPGDGVTYIPTGGDASTAVFYVVGGLPTLTTATTDVSGAGGIINVPVGNLAVAGRVAGHQTPISVISILVEAGVSTYTRMVPLGD